jgi:hypothetical protein
MSNGSPPPAPMRLSGEDLTFGWADSPMQPTTMAIRLPLGRAPDDPRLRRAFERAVRCPGDQSRSRPLLADGQGHPRDTSAVTWPSGDFSLLTRRGVGFFRGRDGDDPFKARPPWTESCSAEGHERAREFRDRVVRPAAASSEEGGA